MKVIIFGATGAVGHSVTKAAVREKYDVTLFVRNKAKLEALLGSEILSHCRVCGPHLVYHLFVLKLLPLECLAWSPMSADQCLPKLVVEWFDLKRLSYLCIYQCCMLACR